MKPDIARESRWLAATVTCLTLGLATLAGIPTHAAKKKDTQEAEAPSKAVVKANKLLVEYSTAKARTALEPEMEDPSVFALTAMGRVLTQEQSYDEAIADLERAKAMTKSDPDPALYLGEALLLAEREGEAKSAFRDAAKRATKLLEKDPENGLAHYQLGVALQRQKKYGDAMASLEEARRLEPKDPMVVYQMGLTRAFQQNWKPAFDLLSEAITMDSKIAYAYYYRAMAAQKVGRGDLLVNDLHRFLDLAPNAPDAERARKILAAATG